MCIVLSIIYLLAVEFSCFVILNLRSFFIYIPIQSILLVIFVVEILMLHPLIIIPIIIVSDWVKAIHFGHPFCKTCIFIIVALVRFIVICINDFFQNTIAIQWHQHFIEWVYPCRLSVFGPQFNVDVIIKLDFSFWEWRLVKNVGAI